jgi:hypothetical protein
VHRGAHGLPPVRYRIDERARLRECERVEGIHRRVETYESFCRATPGRVLPARRSIVVYDADGIVLHRAARGHAPARVPHMAARDASGADQPARRHHDPRSSVRRPRPVVGRIAVGAGRAPGRRHAG